MEKRYGNGNGGLGLGGRSRNGNGFAVVEPPITGRCWKGGSQTLGPVQVVGVKQNSGLQVLLQTGEERQVGSEITIDDGRHLNRLRLLAGRELKSYQKVA